MARPQKQGLDYFPLDTELDIKLELIESEFKLIGFAVVVKLWQYIYKQGYYCEWTDEVALLFSKRNNVGSNVVSEIIKASIRRGIFNKDLYDKYSILTSEGIQKRYFEAVNRRVQIDIKEQYLLISDIQKTENVNINSVNDDINSVNDDINSQIKEKEIKRNDKKDILNNSNNRDFATVISAYESSIGPINPKVQEKLISWLDDVDVSLILYAIEQAVENGVKKPVYIYSILSNQFNSGVTSAEQIEEKKEKNKQVKQNKFNSYGAEYGTSDFENEIMRKRIEKYRAKENDDE